MKKQSKLTGGDRRKGMSSPLRLMGNFRSVPTHPISGQHIKEWLVLGPFFPGDLDNDFLADVGGEANVNPKEGDTVTPADGKTLTWKRYQSQTTMVYLTNAIGRHENAIAYAFCLLQNTSNEDVEIRLDITDEVAVWINGERAYNSTGDRRLPLRSDRFERDLSAGINRCLVKISRELRDWGFAVQALPLPTERAVISGVITDASANPIPNADVGLQQNGDDIAIAGTDALGNYQVSVYPVDGAYDLWATEGNRGDWELGISLKAGERRTLNLTLNEAISISGTLLMLDEITPHTGCVVQAVTTSS
ncbi:MAG: carboxypeptidase-like regulatory domain-containing protein, partial [Candidatus Poribacteria bacterium]|nr:carboxypeptidase-like regulatory domain-containing protein [Candidatus Poribacteria bacterium]